MGKYVTWTSVRVQFSSRLYASDGSGNPRAAAAAARALAIAVLALSVLAACVPGGTTTDPALVAAVSTEPFATRTPFPYTPVIFEELQPYPTPVGLDVARGPVPEKELPDGGE